MKGVGRIYQQTFIDTYAKVAFAKLYDRKTPITAADLLNDRVVPFYDEHEVKLQRVLTDRGTEFCGSPERHEYQLYLAVEDIDHTRTKTKSPQTNGICERFHRTVLDEFYRVAFRKKLYRSIEDLQADLDAWIADYCLASQHPSGYVVENWRATWPGGDPAGWFGFLLARLTRSRAAGPVRTARLKIQGPSGSGCMASIQPASTARRSVFGLIRRRAAALLRLSQGASSSGTCRWTGMPWWERRAVTRSRFQRFPCPVLSPLRFSMPAMTSSDPMRTSWRTAAMMSGEVLLR
jgi:hypothetical protein